MKKRGAFMMSFKKIIILLLLLLFVIIVPSGFTEPNGDQIIAKVDDLWPKSGKFTIEVTMVRPEKDNRTSKMQVFFKGTGKTFARYLAPAEEKGQGYLRLGEDIWFYLPNANKSIRVSARQSMQGSDLSNEDILKHKLSEDYDTKINGEETIDGQANFVLELTAKRPSVAYGKLKYWVRKGDLLPSKTECYAISGKLIKIIIYSQVKDFGGLVRPTVMEISSELRKGYKTIVVFIEADYNSEIQDSVFTKMYLEKGK
jgi:outer membrane lipoprotein-sorting protein